MKSTELARYFRTGFFVACLPNTPFPNTALPQAPHFQTFYTVPPLEDPFSVKKPTYLLPTES